MFVNTRRLAERAARHLSERLGDEPGRRAPRQPRRARSASTPSSASRRASCKALVATASLELGIDIGDVDLVCQLGSTRSIATFLQRVGRSGHAVGGVPKGRLFPLSRDDLVRVRGAPRVRSPGRARPDRGAGKAARHARPADRRRGRAPGMARGRTVRAVPARVSVPRSGSRRVRRRRPDARRRLLHPPGPAQRASPPRRRQRRAARPARRRARRHHLRRHDSRHRRLQRAARAAGADRRHGERGLRDREPRGRRLPARQHVVADPPRRARDGARRGREGRAARRSRSGSARRRRGPRSCRSRCHGCAAGIEAAPDRASGDRVGWCRKPGSTSWPQSRSSHYLAAARAALGVLPTLETLVLERFFDESGGMQLVIHAPFGSRINRAWGLALRKRFCRRFNFELQAAATEDAIVLSLVAQPQLPARGCRAVSELGDGARRCSSRRCSMRRCSRPAGGGTRPRARGPALPRRPEGRAAAPAHGGRGPARGDLSRPGRLRRELAAGDIEIPDHPLVAQTIDDCLHEAMDIDGLERVLARLERGEIRVVARELTEPSPLAAEILTARPYAFLDDAPLEERRTQAVMARRWLDPATAADLGTLDAEAIERVREEAWPDVRNADELARRARDARVPRGRRARNRSGGRTPESSRRRGARRGSDPGIWIAAERLPEFQALLAGASLTPEIEAPQEYRKPWTKEDALVEIVRDRLQGLGPVTRRALAAPLGLAPQEIEAALARARGRRLGDARPVHAGRARDRMVRAAAPRPHPPLHGRTGCAREIEPVEARDFLRFLFRWQRVAAEARVEGADALAAIVSQLEGFEAPAAAWETEILPARVNEYDPAWLDELCLAGRVVWTRLAHAAAERGPHAGAGADDAGRAPRPAQPPALDRARRNRRRCDAVGARTGGCRLHRYARCVVLRGDRGGHRPSPHPGRGSARRARRARRRELPTASAGCARCSCPPIAGDRSAGKPDAGGRRSSGSRTRGGGRSCGGSPGHRASPRSSSSSPAPCSRRYGVVFWRLVEREAAWLPPWRELLRALRRLEARGEIRGGRFVASVSGEQFALPEAVGLLRDVRREERTGALVSLSGADPLNLVGVLTPGARARRPDGQPRALSRRRSGRAAGGRGSALSRAARPARRVERAQRAAAPAGPGAAALPRLSDATRGGSLPPGRRRSRIPPVPARQ